jgi:hypothetical protein
MATHRMNRYRCLKCNAPLSAATNHNGDEKPEPGDVSICIACGDITVFSNDLNLRVPTADEWLWYQ